MTHYSSCVPRRGLFNTGSDVEEDKKTAKAVLEDQQEFYNDA